MERNLILKFLKMINKNIVIIEDEVIIAENLRRIIIKMGFNVIDVANTYKEGLDIIHKDSSAIYLIDINLGSVEGNGIDLSMKLSD